MLPLDVLDLGDATEFLLERTEDRRAETPNDDALAEEGSATVTATASAAAEFLTGEAFSPTSGIRRRDACDPWRDAQQ